MPAVALHSLTHTLICNHISHMDGRHVHATYDKHTHTHTYRTVCHVLNKRGMNMKGYKKQLRDCKFQQSNQAR